MRGCLALAVLSACAVDATDEVTIEPIAAARCSTCDTNGLPPGSWTHAPVAFAPSAMAAAGLRHGTTIDPLCAPGTLVAGTCDLSAAWSAWAAADPRQHDLVRYIVKTGAPHGTIVLDPPSSSAFEGGYGLAPEVLTMSWGTRAQSLVTAAMAVNADFYANAVAICIKTPFTPDCPATYSYQEIASVGNLFAGQLEVVIGGYAALRPEDSRRVCPGFGGCTTYSAVQPYYAATCTYAGPMGARYPTSCLDATGVARMYPVQVFMETDPSLFGAVAAGSGRPML